MESPVVVDKPPEYGNPASNERGFPFEEEEGSGAWSELAARHPDIAARLRQRPATWARKRRPSSQDADDFGDSFGGFDRFPFDDIPPDFREHFPSNWNRRFGSREPQPQPHTSQPQPQTSQSPPRQQTTATQTEYNPPPEGQTHLPQYGLRNTVDLGQKSPTDPSLVDAEDRSQRSVSAPPDSRSHDHARMSGPNHQEPASQHEPSHVRHIPIFVEGRDVPVVNRNVDHGGHYADTAGYQPSPPPTSHIDREKYFTEDPMSYNVPGNFTRAFGNPLNKGFKDPGQIYTHQKVYPQNAGGFARGPSPQRSHSPKTQMHPEEPQYVKVPVQHEHAAPKPEPARPQQKPPQQQPPEPSSQQEAPQQPPKSQSPVNDPITQILKIQTDVLSLMSDVENFTGSKKDKSYLYLDEMLTRNLIKLDDIETGGKENIRQARKEAIRCIQKCIAVLEAKADKGVSTPQPQDGELHEQGVGNGEIETQQQATAEPQTEEQQGQQNAAQHPEAQFAEPNEGPPPAADTGVDQTVLENPEATPELNEHKENKLKKPGKQRDKSKENSKDKKNKNSDKEEPEAMHVDTKGEQEDQKMEVDGAASH